MKNGFATFLVVICFGFIALQPSGANEVQRMDDGLIVVRALNVKRAMQDVFAEVFGSEPDSCTRSQCIQIQDHHYFPPPAYIFYRVDESGNWYHGEYTLNDTIDGIRYFSFGRWRFIQSNTDGFGIKRVNEQRE